MRAEISAENTNKVKNRRGPQKLETFPNNLFAFHKIKDTNPAYVINPNAW